MLLDKTGYRPRVMLPVAAAALTAFANWAWNGADRAIVTGLRGLRSKQVVSPTWVTASMGRQGEFKRSKMAGQCTPAVLGRTKLSHRPGGV